ncbi:MAG: hypothetical protein M1838_005203 [Thelocarpon superellum]|nr:MAG: hypothetical protein M1838_005203 [Thelocarpon superellum]
MVAQLVICADGGANRYREAFFRTENLDLRHRYPDVILGDLDSLLPQVRRYYERRGVQILHDHDQYSTDLTKCLKYIELHAAATIQAYNLDRSAERADALDVVIVGSMGKRLDQGFATLQGLIKASQGTTPYINQIFLLSPENITFMLRAGMNRISTPLADLVLAESIGVLPLGGPATITTRGLEWDVLNWTTQFGGQVSTSNHVHADVVHIDLVQGDGVLVTIELAGRPSETLAVPLDSDLSGDSDQG